jgi:abortive infection bacteriophage resistance protein
MIYTIKDLRNAVAHNEIIFDARFRSGNVGGNVIKCLEIDTGIKGITFVNILDYLILIVYLLKNLNVTKKEILRTLSLFDSAAETLRKKIPPNIYASILPNHTTKKLRMLKSFVRK